MRRETANVLLLLLGGSLLKLAWSGDYLRYVKPQHLWWLVSGGLVVVVLAVASIWRDVRRVGAERGVHGHDPGHAHGTGRSAWLLLVPVLAVLLVAPRALGADSVARSLEAGKEVDAAQVEAYPALPADQITPMTVSQFHARATWGAGKTLVDRQVQLRGFVVRKSGVTYVARVVIGCCAADGYPVAIHLVGDDVDIAGLRDDEWIQVVGRYRAGGAREGAPQLTVDEISRIEPPDDPYE